MAAPFHFALPDELAAGEPPEARGMARDQVRLLVIDRARFTAAHSRFDRLGDFLRAGDLLVFNSSRTLPASLYGCEQPNGPCLELRLAEHLADDAWLALPMGDERDLSELTAGSILEFGHGLTAAVEGSDATIGSLWKLRFSRSGVAFIDALYRLGRPVRYEYVIAPWDIDAYQNVFAREPGSAEMPSAGRPFTWRRIFDLKRAGIEVAYILLHTGLSSLMNPAFDRLHPTIEEEYLVSEDAASRVNDTRERGGRVIAVGTTVVRALETASGSDGRVRPLNGYTRLRITAGHRLRAVDGLLTGLHEPEASHLDLLTAFVPPEVVRRAYEEAIRERYLWHEFGDLNLIL